MWFGRRQDTVVTHVIRWEMWSLELNSMVASNRTPNPCSCQQPSKTTKNTEKIVEILPKRLPATIVFGHINHFFFISQPDFLDS